MKLALQLLESGGGTENYPLDWEATSRPQIEATPIYLQSQGNLLKMVGGRKQAIQALCSYHQPSLDLKPQFS